MASLRLKLQLALVFALFVVKPADADWINLTGAEIAPNIAEIHVLDDHVRINLEVFVGDIAVFEDLVPQEWVSKLDIDRAPLAQRQAGFSKNGLSLTTGAGEILPAQFRLVEPRNRIERRSPFAGKINPYNMRRLPRAPEDKRVLYAEIIYPFDSRPDRLVITPPLNENGTNRVNIGFIAYHRNVPVTDFRFLGRAETLQLDWQDPWYSRFENSNLARHHRYPIMLFLYAEPRRVRMESIMRIDDLEEMLGFDRKTVTSPTQLRRLLQDRTLAYHSSRKLLDIDGLRPTPDSVSIEYLAAGLSGIRVLENSVDPEDSSLLVGVILEYFVDALPNKVDFQWQYFNRRFERIPVIATDPVGPLSSFIDRDNPLISWQNFLKTYVEPQPTSVRVDTGWHLDLPYIGKIKVLEQLPDEHQAKAIVEGSLENIRAAFIEFQPSRFEPMLDEITANQNPSQLKQELAKLFSPSVSGNIIAEVYAFNELRIDEIRKIADAPGFSATVSGTADIRARHWGHLDQRLVSFQLLVDLVEADGQWKLADITVADLKQVN